MAGNRGGARGSRNAAALQSTSTFRYTSTSERRPIGQGRHGNAVPRILPVAFLCLLPVTASGQDSQYWTRQYGPVAELLGGVVVASSRDLSATYYNPGALALAKDPSVLASVESFEATRVVAEAVPPLLDFSDLEIGPTPSLFALALPRRVSGSHTWVFSSLTRQDFDIRLDNWLTGEQAGAEALLDQNLTENWFGLSWAHPAGKRVGVGLTTYVAYRGQRTRRELSGETAASPDAAGAVLLVEDFDYSHYRLLWKGGVAVALDAWDLGLSVTTPGVGLLGGGNASYTVSAIGGDLGSGAAEATVRVRREEDLDSRYKSPWSVAAGAAWRRGASTFHVSAEWFGTVNPFEVLDTSPFAGDTAAIRLVGRLQHHAGSVVNVGFGFQRNVNERFSYYAAFTTDRTFAEKGAAAANSLSTWDVYHLTAGTSLRVRQVKFTLGVAYASGRDERPATVIVVPPGGPPAVGETPVDIGFRRLKVLIGFDFGT